MTIHKRKEGAPCGGDLFQEAKRRIDRRRMNQQLALSARLEEIREKIPEVIEVRRKLAMTSAEVSKLILQKSNRHRRRYRPD